jgi:8-oxo-dGTP pyrophosphatase MutT (NUDIX family)
VRLPNGDVLDDSFVSVRPEIAIIFAVTPADEVLCVRQYKHGAGVITLELPGGTFRTELPEAAAARELREETGYVCPELTGIGLIYDDATKNSNRVHLYCGLSATPVGPQLLDPTEAAAGLELVLIPCDRMLSLVRSGEICAQSSVVTVYRALDYLGRWPVEPGP